MIPAALVHLGLGQLSNSLNANRNYNYAQKAAENDLRRSKEFYDYSFDKVNSYNNPSAVRARMAAAGLNPFATDLTGSGNTSDFGPGSISGDSTSSSPVAAAPTGLEAAQIRKLNAEAESIENQTPSSEDFSKRFTAESFGIELSNIGKDFSNKIASWDAKFAETMKSLEVSKSSAELSRLQVEYQKTAFETKLLLAEYRRQPLINEKLRREMDLLLLQGGLIKAQTLEHTATALDRFLEARNILLEGETLYETLRRMRMENSFLYTEQKILFQSLEEQLWLLTRGGVNTGYGKFCHRLGQFTGALGNFFSGSASYNVSKGSRTSIVTKTIKK